MKLHDVQTRQHAGITCNTLKVARYIAPGIILLITAIVYNSYGFTIKHGKLLRLPLQTKIDQLFEVVTGSERPQRWNDWLGYHELRTHCNNSVIYQSNGTVSYEGTIHIAIAHCMVTDTRRIQDATNLIKSALYFSRQHIHFHIITDNSRPILTQVNTWNQMLRQKFQYTFYSPCFAAENLYLAFKPCAVQRIFIPHIIQEVDNILYLDTDVIFLGPVEDTWAHFNHFNESQIIGLAAETLICDSWYSGKEPGRNMLHPPPHGCNAGVMLWKLDKSRNEAWYNTIKEIARSQALSKQDRDFTSLFDQDYLNEYLYKQPEKLYRLPCSMNFRSDFCNYCYNEPQTCPSAASEGVTILHANRETFHKEHTFKQIYDVFTQLELGTHIGKALQLMKTALSNRTKNECPPDLFLKKITQINLQETNFSETV